MTLPTKVFDCLYGAPGTGKSESCARLAEYLYQTTGLKTRIVLGDGSALTYEHLVQAGVAEVCDFSSMPWPQDTLMALSNGAWPTAQGKLEPTDPVVLATIGLYIFEGLSVAGAYIMGNVRGGLADRGGRGEKIGQDSPIRIVEGEIDPKTGKVIDGPGTSVGGNPPAHYNVAQRTLLECLQRSKNLPCHVIWTAHEATNNPENDLNKELLVGPEVVGKALTGAIQRSFNNTIHCCTVGKRTKQTDTFTGRAVDELDLEYRLYTRDHFSASGTTLTRYKACTRGVDATLPQYVAGGEPGQALLAYYQLLAEKRAHRVATTLTVATTTPAPTPGVA